MALSLETRRILGRLAACAEEPPPIEQIEWAIAELVKLCEQCPEGPEVPIEEVFPGGVEGVYSLTGLRPSEVIAPVAPPYPIEEAVLPEGAEPPPTRGEGGYDPAEVMEWAGRELMRRLHDRYGSPK